MGELRIMFTALIIIAVVVQFLLYRSKDNSKTGNYIFVINVLLGLILTLIVYTSQPSNYMGQKILAAAWGVLVVLSIIIKPKTRESLIISKIMLTVAIFGSFAQIFLWA